MRIIDRGRKEKRRNENDEWEEESMGEEGWRRGRRRGERTRGI